MTIFGTLHGEGIDANLTCPAAPVQIEGTIDGHPFHFRARWRHWSMCIVAPGDSPVGVVNPVPGALYGRMESYVTDGDPDNKGYHASWMPVADAWAIIERCAAQFRAQRQQGSQIEITS